MRHTKNRPGPHKKQARASAPERSRALHWRQKHKNEIVLSLGSERSKVYLKSVLDSDFQTSEEHLEVLTIGEPLPPVLSV